MGDAFFQYIRSKQQALQANLRTNNGVTKKCQIEIAWKQKDALLEEMMENKKGAVMRFFVLANLFVGCDVLWVAIHK